MAELVAESFGPATAAALAGPLREGAAAFPPADPAALALRRSLVALVSAGLSAPAAEAKHRTALTGELARLRPDDPLLRDDGGRHGRSAVPPGPTRRRPVDALTLAWEAPGPELPAGAIWTGVGACGGRYAFFRVLDDGLALKVTRMDAPHRSFRLTLGSREQPLTAVEACDGLATGGDLWLWPRLRERPAAGSLVRLDDGHGVGLPDWWPAHTVAASADAPGVVHVLDDAGRLRLFGPRGRLMHTAPPDAAVEECLGVILPGDEPGSIENDIHLLARPDRLVLAAGDLLFTRGRTTDASVWALETLDQPATGLCGPGPFARRRLCVTHAEGASFVADHAAHRGTHRLGADLIAPRAAFTAGLGHLVLADASVTRVYAAARGEPRLLGSLRTPPGTAPVLRVLPEPRGDAFRVVHADGLTRHHTIAPPT